MTTVRRAQERHLHDGMVPAPGTPTGAFLRDDIAWAAAPSGGGGGALPGLRRGWFTPFGDDYLMFVNYRVGNFVGNNNTPKTTTGTALDRLTHEVRVGSAYGVAGWRSRATYQGTPSGTAFQFVYGFPSFNAPAANPRRAVCVVSNSHTGFNYATDPTVSVNIPMVGVAMGDDSRRFTFIGASAAGAPTTSDSGIDMVDGAVYRVAISCETGGTVFDVNLARLDAPGGEASWSSAAYPSGVTALECTAWGGDGIVGSQYIALHSIQHAAPWLGGV